MKKVLSAVLLFAILVGCFAVFAFAADEAPGVYHDQAYSAGADQYIDVDQYISNAGKSGYTELTLLGINAPYLHVIEHEDDAPYFTLQYDFVFYNPLLTDLDPDVPADIYVGGGLSRLHNYSNADIDGAMFFVLSCRIYANKLAEEFLGYSVGFSDITLYTSQGSSFIDFSRTVVFNDLGELIEYTNPVTDLAYLTNSSERELIAELGTYDRTTILYMYEKGYGTDDYEVYLYIYSPDGTSHSFVGFYEPWDDDVDFGWIYLEPTYWCSDSGIYKYTIKNPHISILSSDASQRDYYYDSIVDASGVEHFGNWHYSFCDTDQASNSYLFGFDYFDDYGGDEGRTAAWLGLSGYTNLIRDIDDIDPGDVFTLYFENKEFVSYDIVSPDLELLEIGDGYVRLIVNDDYSPSPGDLNDNHVQISEIRAYSPYPLFSNEWKGGGLTPLELAFTVTYTPWETGVESYEFVEPDFSCAVIQNDEPILSTSTFYSVRRSSEEGLYLKVNTSEIISTKLHSTYYRIDSSVTANNYYQTLQSVYFSVSDKYLLKNDLNIFNDWYVNSIEFEYWSAFLSPMVFTSNSEFYEKWKDCYNDPDAWDNKFLVTNKKVSGVPTSYMGSWSCDYLIGDSIYDPLLTYVGYFYPDKTYNSLEYLIYDSSFTGFGEFNEIMTSEELLAYLGDNPKVDSKFTYYKSVLFADEEKELKSYYDMTFGQVLDEHGLWCAFLHSLGLYDVTKQETISNIKTIQVYSPLEMTGLLLLSDELLSKTCYVALSDVPALREEMSDAIISGRNMVFFRFDIYDYYAAEVEEPSGMVSDTILVHSKFYKDFDVLKMQISGKSGDTHSLVYEVDAESIDIVSGVTTDDPVDYPDPGDDDFWTRFLAAILEKIRELLMPFAWILVVPVVAFAGWGIVKIVSFVKTRRRK